METSTKKLFTILFPLEMFHFFSLKKCGDLVSLFVHTYTHYTAALDKQQLFYDYCRLESYTISIKAILYYTFPYFSMNDCNCWLFLVLFRLYGFCVRLCVCVCVHIKFEIMWPEHHMCKHECAAMIYSRSTNQPQIIRVYAAENTNGN